jgi:hypothetical protein
MDAAQLMCQAVIRIKGSSKARSAALLSGCWAAMRNARRRAVPTA